jgi:glutathione S-transferase
MPKLKLTYFDFDGGRGEPVRLALVIAGLPFEDDRVKFNEWAARKPGTPFGALPVLQVDGAVISQSNTITRYVGKLTDLYPEDPWQAARCDEVMDAVEDLNGHIGSTISIGDPEAKKTAREALAAGPMSVHLVRLNAYLESRGGEYFADNRLTVADLKVYSLVAHLRSGVLDHIPADLVDRKAPLLVKHADRLLKHAKIAAYYKDR